MLGHPTDALLAGRILALEQSATVMAVGAVTLILADFPEQLLDLRTLDGAITAERALWPDERAIRSLLARFRVANMASTSRTRCTQVGEAPLSSRPAAGRSEPVSAAPVGAGAESRGSWRSERAHMNSSSATTQQTTRLPRGQLVVRGVAREHRHGGGPCRPAQPHQGMRNVPSVQVSVGLPAAFCRTSPKMAPAVRSGLASVSSCMPAC